MIDDAEISAIAANELYEPKRLGCFSEKEYVLCLNYYIAGFKACQELYEDKLKMYERLHANALKDLGERDNLIEEIEEWFNKNCSSHGTGLCDFKTERERTK